MDSVKDYNTQEVSAITREYFEKSKSSPMRWAISYNKVINYSETSFGFPIWIEI